MTCEIEQSGRRRMPQFFVLLAVFALLALCQPQEASAQWATSGNNINTTNTGNVGVGTTTPTFKLDVMGSTNTPFRVRDSSGREYITTTTRTGTFGSFPVVNLAGSRLIIDSHDPDGDNHTIIRRLANHLIFSPSDTPSHPGGLLVRQQGGNPILFVDQKTNGNVGINTASPGARFDISGKLRMFDSMPTGASTSADAGYLFGSAIPSGMTSEVAGEIVNLGINAPQFGAWNSARAGGIIRVDTRSHLRRFAFHAYPTGSTSAQGVERFSIEIDTGNVFMAANGGNVGVGTLTPAYKFDVGGQLNASGGLCIAGDCKTAWSQVGGSGSSQWTTGGSNIHYTAGNIGIGTTAPIDRLHVKYPVGVNAMPSFESSDRSLVALGLYQTQTTGRDFGTYFLIEGGTANFKVVRRTNNYDTDALTILNSNGDVGIGTIPYSKLHVGGDLRVDGNISAKYQDVAEWVPSKQKLAAGTVVVLDTAHNNHVTTTVVPYDTRVAGVISAQPGIALGEAGEGKFLVATTGRVKIKVDATRAAIQIGDLLVTSDVSGVAMKSEPIVFGGRKMHAPGTIVGKALEPLEKGTGEILVLLSLQ